MRRYLAALVVALLVAIPTAAPAGPKKVSGSFGASLAPFPNYSSHTSTARPGCAAGQENVHWVGQEFTAPAAGTLSMHSEGFTGDHDIYVFVNDIPYARGENTQVPDGAPPEESVTVPLKAKQKVQMVACNWLGQPEVEAHYEFVFKK